MAEEAEARVKLVADTSAAESVERLAKAMERTASAQDRVNKLMAESGRLSRNIRPIGSGVAGGGGFGGGPGGGISAPMAGVKHTPGGKGMGGQLDEMLGGRLGLGRAGTMAGGAAAAAAVIRQGFISRLEQNDIRDNPWLNERQKNNAIARDLPFGVGRVFGFAEDLYRSETGRTADLERIRKLHEVQQTRLPFQNRMAALQSELGVSQAYAQNRASAFQGLALARPTQTNRDTALGRKLYEEEQQLLPLIRQRQISQKEKLAAEKNVATAAKEEQKLARTVAGYDKELAQLKRQRVEVNRKGSRSRSNDDAQNDTARIDARLEKLYGLREHAAEMQLAAQQRTVNARQTAVKADFQDQMNQAAIQRQQAQQLQAREVKATGQATRFGMMGIDQRMRGRLAVQTLQRIGIDRATSDLIDAAAAYAPESVQQMAGRSGGAGERELGVARKLTGNAGEFRDTNLDLIRRQADEAQSRSVGTEERAIAGAEAGLAQAADRLGDRMAEVVQRAMEKAVNRLDFKLGSDLRARNALGM